MKRVAFILYSTLFVTVLSPSNLYRIWDFMLIFGFEAVLKCGLAFLQLNERFIKRLIQR
jgi:hypothetical protein